MVPAVADVDADVVKHRRVFQPLALACAQAVDRRGLVEQRQRHPYHLTGMRLAVVAALGQLDDAAPPHVRVLFHPGDVGPVAVDVVERQPLAQGQVAQGQLARAEQPQHGADQDGAGDGQVRAARIEPRDADAPAEIQRRQLLAHAPELLEAYAPVAQRVRADRAAFADGERAEAEDGARRPDDAGESAAADLFGDRRQHLGDVAHHAPLVRSGDRIAVHEPLGQPDDAQLQAVGDAHLRRAPERQLHAAAAYVDDQRRAVRDVHAVDRRAVDEARLLGAGDDADVDPGSLANRGEKLAAVLGLPHGAGRRGDDLVHLVRFGQALELGQRLQGRAHGQLRQGASTEAARAEPDHLLLAVHDLERVIGPHLHHDHVDGVGADVDGRYAHGSKGRRMSCDSLANGTGNFTILMCLPVKRAIVA